MQHCFPKELVEIIEERVHQLCWSAAIQECHVEIKSLYDAWRIRSECVAVKNGTRRCLNQRCGHLDCEQYDRTAFMVLFYGKERPSGIIVGAPSCVLCKVRVLEHQCLPWKDKREVDHYDGSCEPIRHLFNQISS